MKTLLAAALMLLTLTPAFAQPGHIADDVYTFYHSGPSNQYRITGRIQSGEAVTILERNSNTGYIKIRTQSGREGWMPGEYVDTGVSKLASLPGLQADLKDTKAQLAAQQEKLSELQASLSATAEDRDAYQSNTRQLQQEIESLNRQIANMDESNLMRWFTYGGVVALGGVFFGLILPYFPRRRKRRDVW